jgi:hypothetical protein
MLAVCNKVTGCAVAIVGLALRIRFECQATSGQIDDATHRPAVGLSAKAALVLAYIWGDGCTCRRSNRQSARSSAYRCLRIRALIAHLHPLFGLICDPEKQHNRVIPNPSHLYL